MIRLDTVNRSLTLFLGGAQVTAPLQIVVSYSDQTSATYLGSTQLTNSNGTTAVTICSAPIASVIRDIDMVTVLNTDSATQTVTIQLLDTATTYKIIAVALLVGDKLTYTHGSAWQVVSSSGNIKYTVLATTGVDSFSGGSTGLTPATATTGIVTLGGTLAVASGGTGTATPALVAGTNVTITGSWPNQTINSSNSGGTVTSVAALTLGTTGTDVSSTVANSTTTPVITLNLPTASATNRGALSAADWTTFNSKGSGTVTSVTGTAPVVSSGGTTPAISMAAATASVNGYLTSTDWTTFNSKGSGSVTSVAATVPAFLSVTGSPITTSGTLAISYSGTALPIANGGSGQTTAQSAMNSFAGAVTSGSYLRGNGTNVVMATIQAADVPTLNQNTTGNAATATSATTATNIAGGANLQIPYNTASGATSFISAPTLASTYLQYNGTGFTWASAAGLGTVTSVAATVPAFLSITGSPITTAGTLAISYSGTALPIANGGTGQTTAGAAFNALSPITTTGDLIIGNGTNSATRLGIGANTYVLTSNGTTATWAAASGGTPTSIANGTSNVSISSSNGAITASTNGTSALTVTTGQILQFNSGYGSVATAYGCRAWVNFNGQSSAAIRGSANISSITINGTGDWTLNFTTAMPDANYAAVFGSDAIGNNDARGALVEKSYDGTSYHLAGSLGIIYGYTFTSGTTNDGSFMSNVAIFR